MTDIARMAYSPGEVARIMGIARSTVYAAMDRGDIRSIRLGGRRLIARTEVDRLLSDPASPVAP